MTPEQIRAIRDQVGGTRAMAERLEVSQRTVRHWCQHGLEKRPMARMVRELVSNHLVTL